LTPGQVHDWANSAFATTVVAAVFPIYYESTIGGGLSGNLASVYFGYTTAVGMAIVAVSSPVLGAIADHYRAKKKLLGAFVSLGVLATAGLFTTGPGDVLLASALFVLANVGFVGANVFYDSLLGHVEDADPNRLSTAGYALGYVGGGLLLVVNLAWILRPTTFGLPNAAVATRVALLSVAVWWALFSIPLFRSVPEPQPEGRVAADLDAGPVRTGFGRLRRTLGDVRENRDLLLFLVAFLLYADGIGTIIRMASVYGSEIGIDQNGIIGALVLVQFLGVPFAFLFGSLPDRSLSLRGRRLSMSTKRALYLGLGVYTLISIGGFFMSKTWHFWVLAIAVATVQGGTQALSRSLYSTLVPANQSSEFFSFFSISSKFAGIAGPALFAFVGQLTGSSRFSIVALVVFFVGGAAVLSQVDVEAGRVAAREMETADRRGPPERPGGSDTPVAEVGDP
jgi:UMF1 family MFS transporter